MMNYKKISFVFGAIAFYSGGLLADGNSCFECVFPRVEGYVSTKIAEKNGDFSDFEMSPAFDKKTNSCAQKLVKRKGQKKPTLRCGDLDFVQLSNCLVTVRNLRNAFFEITDDTQKICAIAQHMGERTNPKICKMTFKIYSPQACKSIGEINQALLLNTLLYPGIGKWYTDNKGAVVLQKKKSVKKKK